jgi:cephalosporin hydroxylase
MEDTEFFKRFEDGVPTYKNTEKSIENKYALVHFDGPHAVSDIIREVDFFSSRMSVGGFFVFDDTYVGYYDHDKVEKFIFELGDFELVGKEKHKASYKKFK